VAALLGINSIKVSLSHSGEYAIAQATAFWWLLILNNATNVIYEIIMSQLSLESIRSVWITPVLAMHMMFCFTAFIPSSFAEVS
jgi:hypothetical protein